MFLVDNDPAGGGGRENSRLVRCVGLPTHRKVGTEQLLRTQLNQPKKKTINSQ